MGLIKTERHCNDNKGGQIIQSQANFNRQSLSQNLLDICPPYYRVDFHITKRRENLVHFYRQVRRSILTLLFLLAPSQYRMQNEKYEDQKRGSILSTKMKQDLIFYSLIYIERNFQSPFHITGQNLRYSFKNLTHLI